MVLKIPVSPVRTPDSPVEGTGFEPSVPRQEERLPWQPFSRSDAATRRRPRAALRVQVELSPPSYSSPRAPGRSCPVAHELNIDSISYQSGFCLLAFN